MPDDYVPESSDFSNLQKLFEDVGASRLRQSVLQAVAISPLVGLVALDLTKGAAVCPEETLVVRGLLSPVTPSDGLWKVEHEALGEPKATSNSCLRADRVDSSIRNIHGASLSDCGLFQTT